MIKAILMLFVSWCGQGFGECVYLFLISTLYTFWSVGGSELRNIVYVCGVVLFHGKNLKNEFLSLILQIGKTNLTF